VGEIDIHVDERLVMRVLASMGDTLPGDSGGFNTTDETVDFCHHASLTSRLPQPQRDFLDQILVHDPDSSLPAVPAAISSKVSTFTLADTGSNVCLTNDLSILEDVRDIDPSPLDVAIMSTTPPQDTSMCTKMGYIPFT